MGEIDHTSISWKIVCPHCGHKHDDTDFRCDGVMEGNQICHSCDREFSFTSDFTVYWTTEKITNQSS